MRKIAVLSIFLFFATLLPAEVTTPLSNRRGAGGEASSLFSRRGGEAVDYVSTLVGTLSKHSLSTGNTYPAVALPWGMNFWTPQTGKMGDGWQYVYTEDKIRGLKLTHQPSPWINDYGQLAIMATTGKPQLGEDERASWFSHKAEDARPYYYKVYLADWDVTAEMTPTERAVMMRFTFPETEQANIVVDGFDGGSVVRADASRRTITGYTVKNSGGVPQNFRCYFVIQLDRNFTVSQQADGDRQGVVVTMPTRRGQQVVARMAASFISGKSSGPYNCQLYWRRKGFLRRWT